METILIVDDDVSLLESLKMHFEEVRQDGAAFTVVTAHNAAQALKVAQEAQPSLVILDMMLPDRSGLEIVDELRGIPGDSPGGSVTAHHVLHTTSR